MKDKRSNIIQFDILLKPADSSEILQVNNIDQFRPPPENIEKCHRWLTSKGVTCYRTDFGLACSAPAELFESLFSTKVERSKLKIAAPPWHCSLPPKAPPEIGEYIDQISITVLPELY